MNTRKRKDFVRLTRSYHWWRMRNGVKTDSAVMREILDDARFSTPVRVDTRLCMMLIAFIALLLLSLTLWGKSLETVNNYKPYPGVSMKKIVMWQQGAACGMYAVDF